MVINESYYTLKVQLVFSPLENFAFARLLAMRLNFELQNLRLDLLQKFYAFQT